MSIRPNNSKYIALLFMMIISFGAQILGVIKSSLIAEAFGASWEMDAYHFANSIISFLFSVLAAAVPTIVIPCYVERKNSKVINGFLTIVYGVLFSLLGLILIFRHQIVGFLSNRGADYIDVVCQIMLILILAQGLGSVSYVTLAFFQSRGKYNLPKMISLLSQLLVVSFLLVYRNLTILQYTWIVAAGLLIGFFLDLCAAGWYGWRFSPEFAVKSPEILRLLKSFIPIMLSTGVYQLALMTDSVITERLDEGMLTILAYSSQISAIVNSVIVGNLQTYIYPHILRNIQEKKSQSLFWRQSEALHSVVWLVISGFIIIGREGISVLFERGAFSAKTADMVYVGAAIYIFGQQFNMIRDLVYKYFYANHDTTTPSRNSMMVSIGNILISLILLHFIGFYGVILGTVCASCLSLTVIIFKFYKRFGIDGSIWRIAAAYGKNAGIGSMTIIIMLWIKNVVSIRSDIFAILVYGIITVLIYVLAQLLINKKIVESLKII